MDDHRFFLELVAVLVSARLFAAVAVKAGAPAVIGELDQTAVDMTLRLDNAGALPTCPQSQQQQLLVA